MKFATKIGRLKERCKRTGREGKPRYFLPRPNRKPFYSHAGSTGKLGQHKDGSRCPEVGSQAEEHRQWNDLGPGHTLGACQMGCRLALRVSGGWRVGAEFLYMLECLLW